MFRSRFRPCHGKDLPRRRPRGAGIASSGPIMPASGSAMASNAMRDARTGRICRSALHRIPATCPDGTGVSRHRADPAWTPSERPVCATAKLMTGHPDRDLPVTLGIMRLVRSTRPETVWRRLPPLNVASFRNERTMPASPAPCPEAAGPPPATRRSRVHMLVVSIPSGCGLA